ncbi:hypothetical protein SYNPS1DRAFT_14601 [Syncephalis pseudoplumigaleata]|uniref:Peptidase M14 domain-containing protein n=1 Tax=Syncephalis pseudoplumigaleata TaxID=1712513 RepID=A0A4P9Z103_9FUNG|nr:hypothetical protein SYNPS1DRAFT_14601 [Syncephalis pseudoplumigaleata]|eukprot:RKP26153.1 hypothetical protein SYNPS1DRAFT_14601 [Syncephalis pseudoplumigaleata]
MSDNAQYFARLAQTDDWFAEYHTYDDIVWWSGDLAARFPHLVRFVPSIGRTHEGRDIPMLRITAPGGDGGKERKRVWLQSLQHAREWISGSTLQYIAEKLVGGYGKHSRVTRLLKQVEFVLVPVVNPDGYTYTWTTDRLWRKNRRDNGDGTFGVDLNRNWPDHWSSKGLWTQSSSVIYPGPSAASEPEVQALMQAYLKTPNVVAVVDIHSYSQLLLRPFGWGRTLDAGERQYREVADQLVKDLALARGSRYTSEHAVDLYQAKGIAIDWWAGAGQQKRQADSARAGSTRPYAFTLELSPKDDEELGDSGFVLPPSAIRKVGEDVWPMILHLAEIGLTQPLVSRAGAT